MCEHVLLLCRQCYEEWSAYGAEIPMTLCSDGGWHHVIQCYVPYLSGIQLFCADHARRISSVEASAETPDRSNKFDVTENIRQHGNEDFSPPSSSDSQSSGPSTSSSRTVSTVSTDSDSENDDCCRQQDNESVGASSRLDIENSIQSRNVHTRGSVLRGSLGDPPNGSLLFQFFETDPPHNRVPFTDRISELSETMFPGLSNLSTRDLHPASWYAVAWYPLYRLPCVSSDPATARDLQASFLTFHSLSAGPATGAPTPPQLSPAAMGGIAFRAELLRQALLSRAMMAVLPQTPSMFLNMGGTSEGVQKQHGISDVQDSAVVANASLPYATMATSSMDTRKTQLSSMPLAVATLQPFAFAPYKAVGRTWIDDFALHQLHLPMIAAASAWTERRSVVLPDLEFFSRHSVIRQEWLPQS